MLAVDMPFVSKSFLRYLVCEAQDASEAAVVVSRNGGRWEPLCALYRRTFADAAEKALLAGNNKIDSLFEIAEIQVIEEEDMKRSGFSSSIFRNLNTPEQLEEHRSTKSRFSLTPESRSECPKQ